jgi:hypothetical protein
MDLAFMELPLMYFPTTLVDLVLALELDPDHQRKRPKIDPDLLHQKQAQEKEEVLQDLEVYPLNKMVVVPEVDQPKE